MSERLGIILVNFNSWSYTLQCIASLRRLDYPDVTIFVVDNASSDGSAARIAEGAPEVTLIPSSANLGFAEGCNVGMRAALAAGCAFLWLLNNDTEVTPESGRELVRVARAHPEHHFFGCLISFFDAPDLLWYGGGTFARSTGAAKHVGYAQPVQAALRDDAVETHWVTGCSLLLRSESLPTIGWLDKDYFLYAEDVEWQLRAGRGSPRALLVAKNLVRHKVGRSTGSTDGVFGRAFMSRNFVRTALRHAGARLPLWMAWWGLWYCLAPLVKCRWRLVRAALSGAFSQSVPGNELARRWQQ